MLPNQPHSYIAPRLLHRRQRNIHKSRLDPKVMHDLTILDYPPHFGGWANDKKCPKFIYEYREEISYPPGFCPFLGGYCPFCPFCHP